TARNGGTIRFGATLPAAVGGSPPVGLVNGAGGVVLADSGGRIDVRNGANRTAVLANLAGGRATAQGGANGNGVLNTDILANQGAVSVLDGGRLNAARAIGAAGDDAVINATTGSLNISGGQASVSGNLGNRGVIRLDRTANNVGILFVGADPT